ncbi:myosin light chain kinase 3 [Ambystoma mexicanum]|uniref:myosin light chain kinase 3 n=1 Tax=Ambystoma mexicanum TaxID=8296 RepID=UPI0037E9BE8D
MSKPASLTSCLARMYETNLDPPGTPGKHGPRVSAASGNNFTAMDKKLNLLNEKVDKILNFQEDVMGKLTSVHLSIDGLEKGMDKLRTLPEAADLRGCQRSGTNSDSIYPCRSDSIYPCQSDSIYPSQSDSRYPCQLHDICSEILRLVKHVPQDASKQLRALEGVEHMVSAMDKVVSFVGEVFKNSKMVDSILKGVVPCGKGHLAEIPMETKEKLDEKGAKPKNALSTRGDQAEIRRPAEETKKGKGADHKIEKCDKVKARDSQLLNVDCRTSVEERKLSSDAVSHSKTCQKQSDSSRQVIDIDRTSTKQDLEKKHDSGNNGSSVARTEEKKRLEDDTPQKHTCGEIEDTGRVAPTPSSSISEVLQVTSRPSTQCDFVRPSISTTLKKIDTWETISVTKERFVYDLPESGFKDKGSSLAPPGASGSRHLIAKFKYTRTGPSEEGNKASSENKSDWQMPKDGKPQIRFHTPSAEQSLPICKIRTETKEKEHRKEATQLVKSCTNAAGSNKEPDKDINEVDPVQAGQADIDPIPHRDQPTDSKGPDDGDSHPGAQAALVVDDSPPPPAPFGHRIVSVNQAPLTTSYTVCQDHVLGGGRFGQVHRCAEMSSGLTLAAKIIKVKSAKDREEVKNEINIMNQLSHANLIQLYDAFECKNSFTLIMEYVDGGELFDRIADENYTLTELDAILFARQICEGVYYLHQQYILHLDLKPENILCVNHTGNQIKIIDFGLARRYKPREKLKVNFGTPEFLAPEVVNYDFVSFPTDMWSFGVITYMLLSGLSPFLGENDTETMNYIINCNWDFNAEAFEQVSDEARDFISQLLVKEKSGRMSAAQCLKHEWLNDLPAKAKKSKVRLKSQVQLQKYLAHRKWKKHFHVVMAANRLRKLQQMSLNAA